MKKALILLAALVAALATTGCTESSASLEANGNRYEILSMSRFINVTTVYNTNSTITNEKGERQ